MLERVLFFCTEENVMPTFEEFKAFLIEQCSDMKTIFDRLDTTELSNTAKVFHDVLHEYIAVKGHVQSGKTNFMLCMCVLANWFQWSCVVVVRNLQSDVDQFMSRLDEFKVTCKPYLPSIRTVKSSTKSTTPRTKESIYVCLGNGKSIAKTLQLVQESPYLLCIDEVDALDIRNATKRNESIGQLKEKAKCVFGISATVMDPLSVERITSKNIMLLHTTEHYKGMHDIVFHPLDGESKFSGKITDNLFELHEPLIPFLCDFSARQPVENSGKIYPNIALVNIGSTVAPYEELQRRMLQHFPTITTIVYNAKGVTIGYHGRVETRKESISETLQYCKEEGGVERFSHIMIFSGQLAGRGISFTDMDYEWHIHILYLIVSKTCDEMELIQKIRLCGKYNDTIPLELYTTQAIYSDLVKAYYRQEEIVMTLHNQTERVCQDQLVEMTLLRDKFTKRPTLKKGKSLVQPSDIPSETEWSVRIYEGDQLPPKKVFEYYGMEPPEHSHMGEHLQKETVTMDEKELHRLRDKMFRLWSKHLGQTRISLLLDEIDPHKKYSHTEINDMCKRHDIPLQHIMRNKFEKSGSKGYGTILKKDQGMYQLFPELVESHVHYFMEKI